MSVWITIVLVVLAFFLGLVLGSDNTVTKVDCKRCRGRSWHIWVEPTGDPSKYRAKYTDNGRVKYNVQSNGVSNTLRELADEIDQP